MEDQSSESQVQEETACTCPTYTNTIVLFTGMYQRCEICKRCNSVVLSANT